MIVSIRRRVRASSMNSMAPSEPSEDFAETFMLYMKHKGNLPKEFRRKAIKAKWAAVKSICEKVAAKK